jgi:hypothetical protein
LRDCLAALCTWTWIGDCTSRCTSRCG